MPTDIRAQQIRDLPRLHDDLANLAANFLFFVRHVRVGTVRLTLHVHLIRQDVKRTLDARLQISRILIQGTAQQDRDIARICLERIHVANEQENLQHAHREGVARARILSGAPDIVLHIRLEHRRDAIVEAIERRDRTQLVIRQLLRDLLTHAEQRTCAHRRMTTGEQVVIRQASHRLREHLELIIYERVLGDEAIPRQVVVVLLRLHWETEHRREARAETLPHGVQLRDPLLALRQEAASDHVRDLLRRQVDLDREAPLNLREVHASAFVHLVHDPAQFLLRGHEHPGATGAMRRQLLRDGLQVQHQLRVVADELANLVSEEGDALVRPLAIQPRGHILREGLGRQVHLLPIAAERMIHLVAQAGQGLRDNCLREDRIDTSDLPGLSSLLIVGLAETLQLSPILQVTFERTDPQILRIQAARLEIDLVEDLDHRRATLTRCLIILRIDIEEHRARGRV